MKPQVYHVDAFTSQPFRGNSAGVVLPADNLSEAQMQLIARELGHSETAFLLHSDDSDVRIRYFTPTVDADLRSRDSSCALCTCEGVRFRKLHDLANIAGRKTSRDYRKAPRWLSYFAGTRYAGL